MLKYRLKIHLVISVNLFGNTLAADVAPDILGDYEKTLLAIINWNA